MKCIYCSELMTFVPWQYEIRTFLLIRDHRRHRAITHSFHILFTTTGVLIALSPHRLASHVSKQPTLWQLLAVRLFIRFLAFDGSQATFIVLPTTYKEWFISLNQDIFGFEPSSAGRRQRKYIFRDIFGTIYSQCFNKYMLLSPIRGSHTYVKSQPWYFDGAYHFQLPF